jgi:hypothetical protein
VKASTRSAVTPAARDAFLLYVHQWQERLGLLDWRVVVSQKPAGRANMAEVASIDLEARLATIRIGRDFGDSVPVNDASLEALALHEVLHVFLFEFKSMHSHEKTMPDDMAMSAEHRVIHTLVNLLAPEN